MKKIKKTIASVLVLVFALFLASAVMVACSDDEPWDPSRVGSRPNCRKVPRLQSKSQAVTRRL